MTKLAVFHQFPLRFPYGSPMIPPCFPYGSPGVFLGSWLVPARFPKVLILDSTLNHSICCLPTKSLSLVCIHSYYVDRILKTLGDLMENFDSQPRSFMLSTINSFKLLKSSHEYHIMKYFAATLCQNVFPQNSME